jgi:hypothetical protein
MIVLEAGTDIQKLRLWQPKLADNTNNVHVYEGAVKMSAYQPIDIKPLYGRKW